MEYEVSYTAKGAKTRKVSLRNTLRPLRFFAQLCAIGFLTFGCAQKTSKFYPEIIPKKNTVTISIKPAGKHSVNLTYLGAGNMIIEQDGEAIVTDPFFSNQKLLNVLGKVKTNPELLELWKSKVQSQTSRGAVRAALVSHTHYDHVMDLPTLLQTHYFNNLQTVYGNSYLPDMLANFSKEGVKIESLSLERSYQPDVNFDGQWSLITPQMKKNYAKQGMLLDSLGTEPAFHPSRNDSQFSWVEVTPHIRFLAIESNHAPQGKKLHFDGPMDAAYFKEHLIWPGDKIKASKWTTGTTYSFLVDFIQQDTLRMFIQTSASQYPYGRPPLEELKKKKVDVAVICYASMLNVSDYPKAILKDLDPSKVVFVHWEDFFREPKSEDDVMMVRKTNPAKARKRIDELGKKKDFFVMPKPGTKVTFNY